MNQRGIRPDFIDRNPKKSMLQRIRYFPQGRFFEVEGNKLLQFL